MVRKRRVRRRCGRRGGQTGLSVRPVAVPATAGLCFAASRCRNAPPAVSRAACARARCPTTQAAASCPLWLLALYLLSRADELVGAEADAPSRRVLPHGQAPEAQADVGDERMRRQPACLGVWCRSTTRIWAANATAARLGVARKTSALSSSACRPLRPAIRNTP